MARALIVVVVVALVAFVAHRAFVRYVPDRYDPFAPLRIEEQPSFLTGWKLRRLEGRAEACFAALDAAGIEYARMADAETDRGCGFRNAVVLQRSMISWGGALRMTCPLLAAIAVWERHDIQPAAQALLGERVVRIEHFGTYSCRNVGGRDSGRRSQHALANAVDVSGFRLASGGAVSVLDHWGTGGAEGNFLEHVHDRACDRFALVLGPEHDAAHSNHLHLDMGRFAHCR
jgi:hypothetical protein